jgi:methenyltetrahydromethanopterin cyclohydrolase
MLAQAARKAGLSPLVIDLFADCDTQEAAEAVWKIDSLVLTQFAPVVTEVQYHYPVRYVVYGSGFEYHPASLCFLEENFIVLGNSAETFGYLQNKTLFFLLLDRLHIPHPEVRVTAPVNSEGWLVKPVCGQGGIDIQRYAHNDHESDPALFYWQKYQEGSQHSVLFLTDGRCLQQIGFNTQWTISLHGQEFLFSGISNDCRLSSAQKNCFDLWLRKLINEFDLKGLNSLDFIQTPSGESLILEINPRPPASMQLYDDDLLSKHLTACCALLNPLDKVAHQKGYTGYQVVYAEQDLCIPAHFVWHHDCHDIPQAGASIRAGEPICSIITHQKTPQAVRLALQTDSLHLLKGLYSHAS